MHTMNRESTRSSVKPVRIITDSSCDHSFSMQGKWNMDILPLRVRFGEEEYVDGRDLSREKFYELLETAQELPKTAQITPAEFEDVMRPYVEAGEEIVVLPISKEMSGTYQSALLAREQFPGAPIYIVDTQEVTFALGLLVDIAVRLRDEGMDAGTIAEKLDAIKSKVRLYAVIGDLKYLRMGGRLSSAGAVVGTLLGIKPIICIQDGKVIGIDKVRGMKAGYANLLARTEKDGIDTNYPVYFGHSNIPSALTELVKEATDRLALRDTHSVDIGPIVGTHAGPGAVGISFVAR